MTSIVNSPLALINRGFEGGFYVQNSVRNSDLNRHFVLEIPTYGLRVLVDLRAISPISIISPLFAIRGLGSKEQQTDR